MERNHRVKKKGMLKYIEYVAASIQYKLCFNQTENSPIKLKLRYLKKNSLYKHIPQASYFSIKIN